MPQPLATTLVSATLLALAAASAHVQALGTSQAKVLGATKPETVLTYSHASLSSSVGTWSQYAQNHQADPTVGSSVTDATFASSIIKVADIASVSTSTAAASKSYVRPVSSRFSPYNSDGSKVMLYKDGQMADGQLGTGVIVNTKDYTLAQGDGLHGGAIAYVKSLDSNEFRWDRNPDDSEILYWVSGCELYSYDITESLEDASDATVVHNFGNDFENCASVTNGVQGDASADSRYWAFIVQTFTTSDQIAALTTAIITYDRVQDKIIGQLNSTIAAAMPASGYVDISPAGDRVLVQWATNGKNDIFDGPHIYDLYFNSASAVRVGDDSDSSNGWAFDSIGNEIVVAHVGSSANSKWSAVTSSSVITVNVNTGALTTVLYDSDIPYNFATSCVWSFSRSYTNALTGWALASTACTYDANSISPIQNMALLVEVVGGASASSRVYEVGYLHNNYVAGGSNTGFVTWSQDGRSVVMAAQWSASANTWQNTYQITIPGTWLTDLSGKQMPAALGSSDYSVMQSAAMPPAVSIAGSGSNGGGSSPTTSPNKSQNAATTLSLQQSIYTTLLMLSVYSVYAML